MRLFISAEDFLRKVETIPSLTREETDALAAQMQRGDTAARDKLVQGYLPFVASFIRRAPRTIRTLSTVYACIACLAKSVDTFNFSQTQVPFARYLGRALRQCITYCLATRT